MPLLLLIACTTIDLSQEYVIDRTRILAVVAEPAEARPGDTVTFASLTVSPDLPLLGTAWFTCAYTTDTEGCDLGDFESSDMSTLTPEQLAEIGFIGFEPGVTPTWVVPDDILDTIDEADRAEGTYQMLNLAAIPEGDDFDESDLEIAFKRLPVSLSTTPNHNPGFSGLRVDGVDVAPGAVVQMDAGQTYDIEAVLADDAVEDYVYVTSAGEEETRTEEPYLSFYLQEGDFDQSDVLYPISSVRWTTPAEPEHAEQNLWVVIRDRRGGMGWTTLSVRF